MSFESTGKRRCIIQTLDFENCIVTNIKTTARGRKKLRARITREFKQPDSLDEPEEPNNISSSSQFSRASSPVLLSKKKPTVTTKRKKSNTPEKLQHLTPPTPGSPVFKTLKKQKTTTRRVVLELDTPNSLENSSSDVVSSYQIEDFTQESTQSVKISSVESPTANTSSSYSGEANPASQYRPQLNPLIAVREKCESPRPTRRSYKKKSLLGRLERLHKKQASEKLLFQHQKTSTSNLRLSVISFWKEDFNYFLKCRSSSPDFDTTFVVIDSRWVPVVKHLREGAVVKLYPPWQKLSGEESHGTVLLNVICLDVLEETEEPIRQEKSFEAVPTNRFEIDHKLFTDSLFSIWSTGLLY